VLDLRQLSLLEGYSRPCIWGYVWPRKGTDGVGLGRNAASSSRPGSARRSSVAVRGGAMAVGTVWPVQGAAERLGSCCARTYKARR